jgi:soluble lytic murein transglycosylase-like protein
LTFTDITGRIVLWAAACSFVLAASPATAQIYSWRDASGNLVLSNRKPVQAIELRSYAVPKAENVRATRFASSDRSRLYDDVILEHARIHGVRTDLIRAVVQVESAFNPMARSPKGAMGLMQLMPATARQYGVTNPFNPAENIRGGVAYLKELLTRYRDNEELALAAYNAGPGAVDKYRQNVPPYRETQNYVAQINRMAGERPIEMRSNQIYRITDILEGQPVVRYTDRKPTSGSYEVVGGR